MILDKQPFPDDPVPAEAPPSYDTLETTQPVSTTGIEKADPSGFHNSLDSRPFPRTTIASPVIKASLSRDGKRSASWFSFGNRSRAAKEVKATVMGLLRDVVRQPEAGTPMPILQSCAEACHSYGLSFSALLQEPVVEGHTLIYWAVINRPAESSSGNDLDLVTSLLSLAAPLTDATLSEIRLACLHTSDQVLFQRLRRSPAFAPISGTEEMLLGASIAPDEIEVDDVVGDQGAFVVRFRVFMFQKRMTISKQINLEFIARGRLWSLKFIVASADDDQLRHRVTPGTWVVMLSLWEQSPPTWIDSRLIIEEARSTPSPAPRSLANASAPSSPSPPPPPPQSGETQGKPKPNISLRMKTGSWQLAPRGTGPRDEQAIVVSLKDSLMASSLQYHGSSYIRSDGSLAARLEARLAKPEAECIIC
ncbi:hypothetical protein AcW1_003378 [Taiwanofungus camphoratus]|nr:hypothetical protein AcW1_003378 [Antrodia cinnamomea]KAI0943999.1 hypothetical protein AcV7_001936 [Antrodia cinnamomea]